MRKEQTKNSKTKTNNCSRGGVRKWWLVVAEETAVITVGWVVRCKGVVEVGEEVVAELSVIGGSVKV